MIRNFEMTLGIILAAWLLASFIGAVIVGRAIAFGSGTLPEDEGFAPPVVVVPQC